MPIRGSRSLIASDSAIQIQMILFSIYSWIVKIKLLWNKNEKSKRGLICEQTLKRSPINKLMIFKGWLGYIMSL